MPDATQVPAVRRFGTFEINIQTGELRKSGLRLRLSGQPFQVLIVLLERPGGLVTREELRSRLWPADTFVDFDHGLNNAVARIREVLDDSSGTPRYVETVPRRGYRFIAPLTDVPAAIPSPNVAELKMSPAQNSVPADVSGPTIKRCFALSRPWLLGVAVTVVALAAGLALYLTRSNNAASAPTIKSLAVLPLENLSGDPAQEYFADGMTDAVTGRLAMIRELRVVSRTSVMQFKGTRLSAPEIAKVLKVDALVEGSVMKEGNRVRVHAQLIRAAADEHFWSEAYDREMRDVLGLQSDIAQSIALRVKATVTGQEQERLTQVRSVSPEVYESFLKGQFSLEKSNRRRDIEQGIVLLEETIKKDPTFAPAYLGLANAYDRLGTIFVGGRPDEIRPKIAYAARKALELDPGLAEAHVLLGEIHQVQWHWADAQAEYKRALELKPNDASAHLGYANWLLYQGQTGEALIWVQRARELDPLGITSTSAGWILFHSRRYDESVRELRSVLAVHPDDAPARWFLGFALIGRGDHRDAISELEKTMTLMQRSPGSLELLATAYAHAGRRADALRLINELKARRKKTYVPAGALINPYLALGDYDQAFFWFEQAYKEQSNILKFLKVHPFFDPVRDDPRFKDLLHRVGLDQTIAGQAAAL